MNNLDIFLSISIPELDNQLSKTIKWEISEHKYIQLYISQNTRVINKVYIQDKNNAIVTKIINTYSNTKINDAQNQDACYIEIPNVSIEDFITNIKDNEISNSERVNNNTSIIGHIASNTDDIYSEGFLSLVFVIKK